MIRDLAICIAAFIVGTLLAEAFGAVNLGTAFTFGAMAFMAAVVGVILLRARRPSARRPPGA